jgi:Mce-associated membrane protein
VNATWYDVLGVEPTASTDEIRVANQAAEVLLDPERRAAYDAELPVEEEPAAAGEPDEPARAEAAAVPTRPSRPGREPEVARAPRRRPVADWTAALIIVLAALTAVALGYVGYALTRSSPASVENDTTAAQAAAERAVVPILSYDAHHLDQSQAAATPYLTQDYRTQYDKLFAVIRDNAPKTGTVVRAKYLASGVVRSGAGRVDVLVFVNQVTYNKQHPKTPVIYKNQATVTMEKVGNDWLVDNMVTSQQGS